MLHAAPAVNGTACAPKGASYFAGKMVEARAGIEPAYTDLQSAASPLRHRAIRGVVGAGH